MVTEEYRKEIEESLKSLKRILPQNTQVLNEQLVCDFVEEQSNGSFVPNRFPEEFKRYSPNTSFLSDIS